MNDSSWMIQKIHQTSVLIPRRFLDSYEQKNEETKRFEDHKQTINRIKLIFPLPFIFSKNLRIIEKEFSLKKKEEEEEEEIEVNDFKTKRNNYPIVRHVATTNAQTLMNTIACV